MLIFNAHKPFYLRNIASTISSKQKGDKKRERNFSGDGKIRLIFPEVLFTDYVNLKSGDCFTIQ